MQSHPDVAPIGIRVLHRINPTTAVLGTVRVTYSSEIAVLWDDSKHVDYDAQDIHVYDVAQANVRHGVSCDGCNMNPLHGIRWTCTVCENFDLCSGCYHSDVHDLEHAFTCIVIPHQMISASASNNNADSPANCRYAAPPRKVSSKLDLQGIVNGATVRRGEDWMWNDEDDYIGKTGTVCDIQTWLAVRDAMAVKWEGSKLVVPYRVGCEGRTDLTLVQMPPSRPPAYVEHLPTLDAYMVNGALRMNEVVWLYRFSQLKWPGNLPTRQPASESHYTLEEMNRLLRELRSKHLKIDEASELQKLAELNLQERAVNATTENYHVTDSLHDLVVAKISETSDVKWKLVDVMNRRASYHYEKGFIEPASRMFHQCLDIVQSMDQSEESKILDLLYWKCAVCAVSLNKLSAAYHLLGKFYGSQASYGNDVKLLCLNFIRKGLARLEPPDELPDELQSDFFLSVRDHLLEAASINEYIRKSLAKTSMPLSASTLQQEFNNMIFFYLLALNSLLCIVVYEHMADYRDMDERRKAVTEHSAKLAQSTATQNADLMMKNSNEHYQVSISSSQAYASLMEEAVLVSSNNLCSSEASAIDKEECLNKVLVAVVNHLKAFPPLQQVLTYYPPEVIDLLNVNNSDNCLCMPLSECRFKFIRKIGSGACGTVFEASQTYRVYQKSSVAVKMLHFIIADEAALEDMRRVKSEVELNVQLARSSIGLSLAPSEACSVIPWAIVGSSGCIVRYHFIIFFEMELADDSLAGWLKKRNARIDQGSGVMSSEDYFFAVKFAKDVAMGLQLLHERNEPVIHGDLHLGNVLISYYKPYPVAKLADFSNSKFANGLVRKPNAVPFVPVRSPSSQSGRAPMKEDDIYALGKIVLYLLLPQPSDIVEDLCENIVFGNVDSVDVFDKNYEPLVDLAFTLLRNDNEPRLALEKAQVCFNKLLQYLDRQFLTVVEPPFDGFDSPPLMDMFNLDVLVERTSKHAEELVHLFCSLQQQILSESPEFQALLSEEEWKVCLEQFFPYCLAMLNDMQVSYQHHLQLQAKVCSEMDSVFNAVASDFILLQFYSVLNDVFYEQLFRMELMLRGGILPFTIAASLVRKFVRFYVDHCNNNAKHLQQYSTYHHPQ